MISLMKSGRGGRRRHKKIKVSGRTIDVLVAAALTCRVVVVLGGGHCGGIDKSQALLYNDNAREGRGYGYWVPVLPQAEGRPPALRLLHSGR